MGVYEFEEKRGIGLYLNHMQEQKHMSGCVNHLIII